MTAHITTIIVM